MAQRLICRKQLAELRPLLGVVRGKLEAIGGGSENEGGAQHFCLRAKGFHGADAELYPFKGSGNVDRRFRRIDVE